MTVFDMEQELPMDGGDLAEADSIELINRRVIQAMAYRIKSRQITKKQLAERMGINKSEVSRLLRGNTNLTARKLGRLLWALDYDFDLLLCDVSKARYNSDPFQKFLRVDKVGATNDSQESSIVINAPSLQVSQMVPAVAKMKLGVPQGAISKQVGRVEIHGS